MTSFILRQQSLLSQNNNNTEGSIVQFSLPLNEKLNSLDRKSNKLLQKVLAIQQQIQKYAQTQNKQLLPITEYTQGIIINSSSSFGSGYNSQSVLSPRKGYNNQMHNQSQQHHLYVKKMANLGRNKVKMIQSLEQHILSLQVKFSKNNNGNGNGNVSNSNGNSNSNSNINNGGVKLFKSANDLLLESNNSGQFIKKNNYKNNKNNNNNNNNINNLTSLNGSKQSLQQQQQHHQPQPLPTLNSKNSLQQQKKQIDSKFLTYYRHKNNILKQSKSQKFSFRQLKYLTKHNNIHQEDSPGKHIVKELNNGDVKNVHNNNNTNNIQYNNNNTRQQLQSQLFKLKQQFTAYQQRTSKQLQSYKQKLNQNILQKEILKKQLQREKYDHLKDKLFNKTKSIKSTKMLTQRTARDFNYNDVMVRINTFQLPKQNDQHQHQKEYQQQTKKQPFYNQQQMKNMLSFGIKLAKTDRPTTNDQQQQQQQLQQQHQQPIQDLQVLKDQLSMRYVQQNEQILQLRDKLKQSQQLIQQLRQKMDKNHLLYSTQLQQFHEQAQQKQQLIQQLHQTIQQHEQQLSQYKQQIDQMNNFIYSMKEENQKQHQEIEEYKSVIEQFLQQVGTLRAEVVEKNHLVQQMNRQIQQAARINNQCQQQIYKLKQQHYQLQSLNNNLQHNIKTKQSKINYLQTLINKHKLQQQQSTISSNTKINKQINQRDQVINQLKIQNQVLNQLKSQHLQQMSMMSVEMQQYRDEVQNVRLAKLQQIKEKQQIIQQLQQNIHLLKSNITQQVDREVNQAIRTFLRYRKHTCRLVENTIKTIIYHKNSYITKQQIDGLRTQLRFSQLVVGDGFNVNVGSNNKSTQSKSTNNKSLMSTINNDKQLLTLRKLIDLKFSHKTSNNNNNSINMNNEKLFKLKLTIIMKLIQFIITYLNNQLMNNNNSTLSTKSIKSSNKKLLSLLPQNIVLIKNSQQQLEDFNDHNNNNNIQHTIKMIQQSQNLANYHFTFNNNDNNNKHSQSKKDKSLIYLSPQVLLSMNESQNSYIWTLGILIDEIINHKPYYTKIQQITSRKDNYKFVNLMNYSVNPVIESLQVMLVQMLKKNFKQRPSLEIVYQQLTSIGQMQQQQFKQQQQQ